MLAVGIFKSYKVWAVRFFKKFNKIKASRVKDIQASFRQRKKI